MAVRLRMKRFGRRHRAFFRINAVDSRRPRDGRVLEEMIDPALLAERPVRMGESAGTEDEAGFTDPGYTDEEEEQIRDRLSQWGYL